MNASQAEYVGLLLSRADIQVKPEAYQIIPASGKFAAEKRRMAASNKTHPWRRFNTKPTKAQQAMEGSSW